MGADLYIKNLPRKAQYTGWRTDIDAGYFRCAYNRSDVLWQFGLSWWVDVAKGLCSQDEEEGSILTLEAVKKFIKLLKDREPEFRKNLKSMLEYKNPVWDYKFNKSGDRRIYDPDKTVSYLERKKWVKAYKDDYKEFKDFLNRSLEVGSPIICSL